MSSCERAQVDAAVEQRPHQRLGVVHGQRSTARPRRACRAPRRTLGVGQQRRPAGTPRRPWPASRTKRQAEQGRPARRRRRPTPRPRPGGRRSSARLRAGARPPRPASAISVTSASSTPTSGGVAGRGARRTPRPGARRACGTRGSRTARAPRRRRPAPIAGRRGRRRAATSRTSTISSAFWRTWASCSARFGAQLGRLLVEVGEDPVEAAVGVDQLGRRLLPHPGHAGQVVGRVAAERGVLRRSAPGVHAGALEDAGLVVEGVVGHAALVVEHLDVRVLDQLVAVAVAGDDDDVVAVRRGPRWPAWR